MFQFLLMIKHILFPALCPLDLKLILFQTFSDAFAFLASCQLRSSEHTMFIISAYVELDFFIFFYLFMQSSEKLELSAGGQSQHYSAKAPVTFIYYLQIAQYGTFERIIYRNSSAKFAGRNQMNIDMQDVFYPAIRRS